MQETIFKVNTVYLFWKWLLACVSQIYSFIGKIFLFDVCFLSRLQLCLSFWWYHSLLNFMPEMIFSNKSVFFEILHHSSVSWGIALLYFFSWMFIYFQQKDPIKAQIWWNFMWAVEILHFDGLLLSKSCTVSAKKLQKSSHNTKEWCKI